MIPCERCGRPVEMEEREDRDGYLCTGRCRACRVGAPAWVGMIENLLGGKSLPRVKAVE